MKKLESKGLVPFERTSFTVSKINQDEEGNKTVHRTYWSVSKKVQKGLNENGEKSVQRSIPDANNVKQKRKSGKPIKEYTQIPLFPNNN